MPVGVHIILLFNGVFTLTVTDTETEADKMDRTQWEFVWTLPHNSAQAIVYRYEYLSRFLAM